MENNQLVVDTLRCVHIKQLPWGMLDDADDVYLYELVNYVRRTWEIKPAASQYQRLWYKRCLAITQRLSLSDSEEILYELVASTMTLGDEDLSWKTYIIAPHTISLQETVSMTSRGTTGLRSWGAAYALASFLMSPPCVELKNLRVLELGAGPGLVGILASKTGLCQSVTLSDVHSGVLDLLAQNVSANEVTATVSHVDWRLGLDSEMQHHYDLILAADVVFDKKLLPDLAAVMHSGLAAGGQAMIASTIRDESTFQAWITAAEQHMAINNVFSSPIKDENGFEIKIQLLKHH